MCGRLGMCKGVLWVCFWKRIFLGYFVGICMERLNWCELRSSLRVSLGNF